MRRTAGVRSLRQRPGRTSEVVVEDSAAVAVDRVAVVVAAAMQLS
jgi:hypothetical protein